MKPRLTSAIPFKYYMTTHTHTHTPEPIWMYNTEFRCATYPVRVLRVYVGFFHRGFYRFPNAGDHSSSNCSNFYYTFIVMFCEMSDIICVIFSLRPLLFFCRKSCGRNIPKGIRIEFRFIFSLHIYFTVWVQSHGQRQCAVQHTAQSGASRKTALLRMVYNNFCVNVAPALNTPLFAKCTRLIADSLKVHMPAFWCIHAQRNDEKNQIIK